MSVGSRTGFVQRRGFFLAAFVAMTCLAWGLPVAAQASTVPVIDSESVSNVTSSDATLEARIDVESLQHGADYQFQIVENPSEYASELICPSTRPQGHEICVGPQSPGLAPIGFVPSDEAGPLKDSPVSLDLGGAGITLNPGTTYHYRVLAARSVQTEDTIQWEGPTVYGADQTFTTSPSPPVIESESVSHITPTDTTLEAQINPGGLETTYEVWVGTVSCIEFGGPADTCESTGKGEIVGTISAGTSTQTVSVDVAKAWRKLAPNSLYVFTVSATNSAGKANSDFKIFKTAAGVPPAIEGESVSNVTPTEGTLEAQINSEGLETTYQFRLESGCLWPQACPEITVYPLPSGKLLGSFVDQSVSLDLNSAGVTLAPGVEYAYSVTATNAAGSVAGHEQRFTTPEDGAQPLSTPSGAGRPVGPNSGDQPAGPGGSSSLTPGVQSPDPQVPKTIKLKALTNAQKLSKALKLCDKKPKKQRPSCKRQAEKNYAATSKHRA
jgi:hypothetical protein